MIMENILLTIPFPGFYDSALSDALDFEEEMLAESLTDEFPTVDAGDARDAIYWAADYPKAYREIARDYAEDFAHMLNEEMQPPFALEFESITSPREYNFTTDRCFMQLPLADFERMRKACDEDKLAALIRETFTSRDGFASFYSNDINTWNDKPLGEYDHNEAGTVLRAYIATHCDDPGDLEWRIVDRLRDRRTFGSALDAALDWDALRARMLEN